MRNTIEQDKHKKQLKKIVITRQLSQKVNEILTSGTTTGEMLAELQKIIPQFDYEEADA